MTNQPIVPKIADAINVIQAVHRHPKPGLSTRKPPTRGPIVGPSCAKLEYQPVSLRLEGVLDNLTKVAPENIETATPRSTGAQKSARAPPTTVKGAQPKNPDRKRQTKIVSTFCATATGTWNIPNMTKPTKSGILRP